MKSKDSNSKKQVSYQKHDGRGHARPAFFWYDNEKDLKVCFLVTRIMCSRQFYHPIHFNELQEIPTILALIILILYTSHLDAYVLQCCLNFNSLFETSSGVSAWFILTLPDLGQGQLSDLSHYSPKRAVHKVAEILKSSTITVPHLREILSLYHLKMNT